MNKYPKVSIMIPTYNQEKYISEAIESALMQDYQNLEIIVADDCSTDNTQEIVKKFQNDTRLRYYKNEKNLGRVENYYNILHKQTRGEWIVNLDGDDYFVDHHFITYAMNEIVGILALSSDIVAYCYNLFPMDYLMSGLFPYKVLGSNSILFPGKVYFLNYYNIGGFSHSGTIFNRAKAMEIGGCYTKSYQASDFHALMRIILSGDIIINNKKISFWRVHSENTTVAMVDRKQKEAMQTFDDIENFAILYCTKEELNTWRKRMNKFSYRDYIATYVYCHRNLKAFWLMIKTFRISREYFRLWFHFLFNY